MYELSVAGLIALLFGLASYYGLGEMGIFSQINLALGGLALLAAMASGFRRLGSVGGPHSRPVIARGLALIAAAIALGVLAERMADRSDIHFDLTFEHAFEVSPPSETPLPPSPFRPRPCSSPTAPIDGSAARACCSKPWPPTAI